MEILAKADAEQRIYNAYTADCLGMLIRQLYGANDFKLFTDYIASEEKEHTETREQVADKILRLLDGVGKGVATDGSIQSCGKVNA